MTSPPTSASTDPSCCEPREDSSWTRPVHSTYTASQLPDMLLAGGVCLEEVCTCAGLPLLVSHQSIRVELGRTREAREGSKEAIQVEEEEIGDIRENDDISTQAQTIALGASLSYMASQEVPPPFPSHIACDVSFTVRTRSGILVAHRTLLNHFNADAPTWGIGELVPMTRIQDLAEQEECEEKGMMDLVVQVVVQPIESQGGWIDGGIAEGCPGVEDVLLYSQGGRTTITAARVSLASRSPYFRELFLADFPYPPPDDYPIDEEPRILQWLIHYAYHGTIPGGLNTADYRDLYAASTRLRFPDLRAILSSRLTMNLDLTSALALVPLAWEYGDPPMKSSLLRLLRQERRGLAGREDFVRLVRTGAYAELVDSLVGPAALSTPASSSSSSSLKSALPSIS
ncbi:hypothetical protein BJ684DRAFT_21488 [Piptocephalis cylindrospora]|uniref:BTB domain-containing protein n=1 Tax=Piptocephalis cylindrospora TaxID=1907219 RepID=A0A4P9XZL1_9FUNG|nr:hypothetical protein BJ684DRAFT_21488 [Piptocephalis cylindrospora]|eukprot:RKP11936.1 hypothetical protein BJ684DRAFT_21488 [Piptocephalis cylindrospora]